MRSQISLVRFCVAAPVRVLPLLRCRRRPRSSALNVGETLPFNASASVGSSSIDVGNEKTSTENAGSKREPKGNVGKTTKNRREFDKRAARAFFSCRIASFKVGEPVGGLLLSVGGKKVAGKRASQKRRKGDKKEITTKIAPSSGSVSNPLWRRLARRKRPPFRQTLRDEPPIAVSANLARRTPDRRFGETAAAMFEPKLLARRPPTAFEGTQRRRDVRTNRLTRRNPAAFLPPYANEPRRDVRAKRSARRNPDRLFGSLRGKPDRLWGKSRRRANETNARRLSLFASRLLDDKRFLPRDVFLPVFFHRKFCAFSLFCRVGGRKSRAFRTGATFARRGADNRKKPSEKISKKFFSGAKRALGVRGDFDS